MHASTRPRAHGRPPRLRGAAAIVILGLALVLSACGTAAPHQGVGPTLTHEGYGTTTITDEAVDGLHELTVTVAAVPPAQEPAAASDRAAGLVWQQWIGPIHQVRVVEPDRDTIYGEDQLLKEFGARPAAVDKDAPATGGNATLILISGIVLVGVTLAATVMVSARRNAARVRARIEDAASEAAGVPSLADLDPDDEQRSTRTGLDRIFLLPGLPAPASDEATAPDIGGTVLTVPRESDGDGVVDEADPSD